MKHEVKSKETTHFTAAGKSTPGKNANATTKPGSTSSGLAHWLGGSAYFKLDIRTDFDIIKASESGITKASVDELSRNIGVSKKDMAEEILDVSIKTLERKNPSDKLDKKISSHVLEVARVMQHAFDVFEDEEKAKQWLNHANRALNGATPVQLLDTMTGINMVNDVLTRIEEGVYS
jgi:putative toxin-antitoxin system antitoxin component (TIGR02293 family)